MRLWTVHPKYLDTKGLLAVWREGLLAQKVLKGETKGYRGHPQLKRFQACPEPIQAIGAYLVAILDEATTRRYNFDGLKIISADPSASIVCTRGQLSYEWKHLKAKLKTRDPVRYQKALAIDYPEPHPLFTITAGPVESWEVVPQGPMTDSHT